LAEQLAAEKKVAEEEEAKALADPFADSNPVGLGGSKQRKNHLTRKQQWTRSKPSRFKTHRIY